MIRLLVLVAALGACKSDRERDCAAVRDVLKGRAELPPPGPDGDRIVDMAPFNELRELSYRDAEVRDAAHEVAVGVGFSVYSPWPDEPVPAIDRLAKLCGLASADIIGSRK